MKKFIWDVRQNKWLLLLGLPGIIWFGLFCYAPMFGIVIAFKDFNYVDGIFRSPWIGLKNFEFIFKSKDLFVMLRNTLGYNLVWIPLNMALAVFFAIMFDALGKNKLNKINQTISILPHFLSMVVVSYFVDGILNTDKGILNHIMNLLGISPKIWYSEVKAWPFILTIVNSWKGVGWSSIIYYTTIAGIPQDYYEAAKIDGANWYQRVGHITLPLLKPILTLMGILSIGGILGSDFGLFYIIPKNSGVLYPVTQTFATYVYNGLMGSNSNLGMTAAAGFFQMTGSIPREVIEAGKIDGATEFKCLFKIVLPMSVPVIATIALFLIVAFWNDWYTGFLYILKNNNLVPISLLIQRIEQDILFLANNKSSMGADAVEAYSAAIPEDSFRMGLVIITILPMLVSYPFFQQYFVKGMTIGAVKG